MEYPERALTDDICAYLTRDYNQVIPGQKAAFQVGFIVLKPDTEVLEECLEIIGRGTTLLGSPARMDGGMGYGGVARFMVMKNEGIPGVLLQCGLSQHHSGGERAPLVPNFVRSYRDLYRKCHRNLEGCEDCHKTKLLLIISIHFTNCRK